MNAFAPSAAVASPWRHALLALVLAASASRGELAIEKASVATPPPADAHRIYLADPSLPHLVDGRLTVLDGSTMRVLAVLGVGFSGLVARAADASKIYVATTYYSRLQRGSRTDVVEVYDGASLTFEYEIEIPPKHAEALPIRPLMTASADGRFLLIQNATPATSITVVDLAARRVAGELTAPGCWGIIPWPGHPRRFASLCGDGTLATLELAEDGGSAKVSASRPFFDPDSDPLFIHYELAGSQLYLLSYLGKVHPVSLDDDGAHFDAPWSLLSPSDAKRQWRPGGFHLFSVDPVSQRLYVGMHDHGHDGSHKEPATEIWSFDLASRRRLTAAPGHAAISLALEHGPQPRLYLIDAAHDSVLAFDPQRDPLLRKPLARLTNAGDTPVVLETQ